MPTTLAEDLAAFDAEPLELSPAADTSLESMTAGTQAMTEVMASSCACSCCVVCCCCCCK